jgi:plastocyanin
MSISSFVLHVVRRPSSFSVFFAFAFALGSVVLSAETVRAEGTHDVEISIKDHKFDPPKLTLPSGKPIKILVKNLDATPEEFESHDLGFEKIIPGNSSATVRVKPLKPGTYMFFGEFHQDSALGHAVVE